MHFNIAPFLPISMALASLFAIGASYSIKMTNMNAMSMAVNGTSLGHAVVSNRCELPIYLWSVGENISLQTVVRTGHNYSEVYRRDPKTGGVAIKITTVREGLYSSAPQTVFAYNLIDNVVWYDLSDVFGDPFSGEHVSLLPSEPAILWEEGVPPRGSQVRMHEATTHLVLTVC